MITAKNCLFFLLILCKIFTASNGQSWGSSVVQGKGKTDDKPMFLNNNYIPASMHVIFYLTDSMKYEIRPASPGGGGGGSTTTTIRPTPPHKPGNYAPEVPPGPNAYFATDGWTYAWRQAQGLFGNNQNQKQPPRFQQVLPEDIDLFGAGPRDIIHQINTLEDEDTIGEDEDLRIEKFAVNYEDTVNLDFLRKKKIPPTRAFVTLLSLYDALNRESKELGLNKYNGYSDNVLKELSKTSQGSASDQLKFVLSKVIEKKNTKKDAILNKIKAILKDLEKPDGYMNEAIRYIPPLQFSL